MAVTMVADSLVLKDTNPSFSQAVSMDGANTVQPQIVLTVCTATSLTLGLEGSNDLANWSTISTSWTGYTLGVPNPQPAHQGNIAWQYVRLKFTLVGSGVIILNANVATAHL
ncbi:MAG: hypothetical protein IPK26_21790 [Planctomycetes bacterium]|nr:hypothetical protein [Planctomycetota bacterium]